MENDTAINEDVFNVEQWLSEGTQAVLALDKERTLLKERLDDVCSKIARLNSTLGMSNAKKAGRVRIKPFVLMALGDIPSGESHAMDAVTKRVEGMLKTAQKKASVSSILVSIRRTVAANADQYHMDDDNMIFKEPE
jgi:hypothetical protein